MHPKTIFCLAALALPLLSPACAIAADPVHSQVGVLVEYIDVPEPVATRLQREHRGQRDSSEMREALQSMIDKGDARLVDTAYLRATAAQRAKLGAADRILFPADFDPPEAPERVVAPVAKGAILTVPANPTSFQYRPAGLELEVVAHLGVNGEWVELDASPERVEYFGNASFGRDEAEVTQPIFFTMKHHAAVSSQSGDDLLIAVHVPSGAPDKNGDVQPDPKRRMMVFARPSVLAEPEEPAGVPALSKVERASPAAVGILVEHVELDAARANHLLRNEVPGLDATDLYAAAAEAGEIVEASYIASPSGQRARIESHHEWISPASGDPGSVPAAFVRPAKSGRVLALPKIATSFSMRPVGNRLEVDPQRGRDGLDLKLNLASNLVTRKGELVYGKGINQTGQPRFRVEVTTTSISSRCGSVALLGAHPAASDRPGRSVLTFARSILQIAMPGERERERIEAEPALLAEGAVLDDPFANAPLREPAEEPLRSPKMIRVSYEEIEISRERFALLFGELDRSADSTAVREALSEDLESGAAMMRTSGMTQTRPGQRAKIEAVREYLYPTEFDPPDGPAEITGSLGELRAQVTVPASGSAFQMVPLGLTLEIEPSVGRDKTVVEMRIDSHHRWLDHEVVYGKDEAETPQPIFGSLRAITSVPLKSGADFLFAVATPRETGTADPLSERRVLCFIRADVETVE